MGVNNAAIALPPGQILFGIYEYQRRTLKGKGMVTKTVLSGTGKTQRNMASVKEASAIVMVRFFFIS